MPVPLLQMSAISKRFPGVVALDRVDFEVAAGEIVALVGENGAGKSTLMKILAGIHRAGLGRDPHRRRAGRRCTRRPTPRRLGIGVIHQELEVIDTLDVAGNVFLGREPTRGGPLRLLDRRRMDADAERQLARIGVPAVAADAARDACRTAQQQLVAIARALSMNARLLILDEPTSSLDVERRRAAVRRASRSARRRHRHRLHLASAEGNRAAGRPRGRAPGRAERRDAAARGDLARSAGAADGRARGRAVAPSRHAARGADRTPGLVLQIERLRTGRYPGVEVSLTVQRGEVLGHRRPDRRGPLRAGRGDLRRRPAPGRTHRCSTASRSRSARRATRSATASAWCRRTGAGCGVIAAMSVRENVTLPALAVVRALRSGRARPPRPTAVAAHHDGADGQGAVDRDRRVATLSGGNQQKVVLGKWLALRPRVIVFDEPTQGVDVGAKAEIHRLIRGLADEGAAVVMISSDMEEIVAESDRVAVMHDGRVTGILARADVHARIHHAARGRVSAFCR